MPLPEGRNALLGSLLRQHGEEPAPEIVGPIVPNNDLSPSRPAHSPFDLVAFLESQRGHPPSLNTCVPLSDNQGHISIRGLKSTKMAFGKMVKEKTWGWLDANSTAVIGSALFTNICKATSGCVLTRSGDADGTQAVNTTSARVFFRETDATHRHTVYMFLAWKMKFDGTLFEGSRRVLGFFYVYRRDNRCSRFNADGYISAWLPDTMSAFSCFGALRAHIRLTGTDLLPTVSSSNPIPIPPNVVSICKAQRPGACAHDLWDTLLLPFRHTASDALKSCTSSTNTALLVAAQFILLEFYPQLAESSALALVIAWGAHELQGGAGPFLASGSPIYKSAVAYLGANAHNPSLVPYLFAGAPPEFIKFVWNAGADFNEVHTALLTVAVREAHVASLVASLSEDDRWAARLRALVEVGKAALGELRALLGTSRRTAMLGSKWRAVLPLIAGRGVERIARMLETTPRLSINRQVLVNLITYVQRQINGLVAVLHTDNTLDARPDLAVGIVWVHTQADIVLAHDRIRAANIDGSDTVLAHYRRLFAHAPGLATQQAQEDARITARHLLSASRAQSRRESDARKRQREIASSIDGALRDLRQTGDTQSAVRVLKRLRKETREPE